MYVCMYVCARARVCLIVKLRVYYFRGLELIGTIFILSTFDFLN